MGPTGGQAGQAGGLAGFLPIIILFAIFYFLLIRPQQKKAKEHREMVNNLKKGARIITSGGIYGTILSIDDTTIGLEIAEKVKIKATATSINTKWHQIEVGDVEGHVIAAFENTQVWTSEITGETLTSSPIALYAALMPVSIEWSILL